MMMLVPVRVMPGRRARDRFGKKVYVAGQEFSVTWGPVWERKRQDGDIIRLDVEAKPGSRKHEPEKAAVTE